MDCGKVVSALDGVIQTWRMLGVVSMASTSVGTVGRFVQSTRLWMLRGCFELVAAKMVSHRLLFRLLMYCRNEAVNAWEKACKTTLARAN